jgi:hypothetical protein
VFACTVEPYLLASFFCFPLFFYLTGSKFPAVFRRINPRDKKQKPKATVEVATESKSQS